MASLNSPFVASLLAASALALSSPAAQARIVCNDYGECWRVHGPYPYYPQWGWSIRPYQWRWQGEGEHRHDWHERRGHWHGGDWED